MEISNEWLRALANHLMGSFEVVEDNGQDELLDARKRGWVQGGGMTAL